MKYHEDNYGILYLGDALEVIKTFSDETVDCVMTSPPYWKLRDFNSEKQLGQEKTHEEYLRNLLDVFGEIKRVLKKSGTCWVNIGDTYMNKNLMQIPSRFAIGMCDMGWILRNEIIWKKTNTTFNFAEDRFTVDYDKVFFFVKNTKYWFERQYDPLSPSTYKKAMTTTKVETSKKADALPEWERGYANEKVYKYRQKIKEGKIKGVNKRCVWEFSTQRIPFLHFAPYPEKLCETPIKAGCPENGIVLDPFVGSGTTCVVAKKLNRRYIGIDVNGEYLDYAIQRLKEIPDSLFMEKKEV